MPLFKSSKNQSASAVTTPAATPRSSMQQQRPTQAHQMTQEQALKILFTLYLPLTFQVPFQAYSATTSTPTTIITIMPLFKSSKNKSASAATTPAATPRSSMQQQRPAQAHQMTQEQALKILLNSTMGNAASGPYIG
ncbi:MAG: hypothetical protein J3Q66DRAFT_441432 [Benniella sp.]|nr:MAG: hypothetical protein J3Q66DRAFT_441432 [Benniella sp.]